MHNPPGLGVGIGIGLGIGQGLGQGLGVGQGFTDVRWQRNILEAEHFTSFHVMCSF